MRRIVICIAIGVAAWAAVPVVRTALRYRAINTVLGLPEARQRMSVVPVHRTFLEPESNVQRINLGYAAFDIGFTDTVSRVAVGGRRTCVLISNATVEVCFMAPFAPETLDSAADIRRISGSHTEYPESVAHLKAYLSDPVQAEINTERTEVASLSELAWMTKDRFLEYQMHVIRKAGCNAVGWNEVISFNSPFSKGVIQIGKHPADRIHASVVFASPNHHCLVGCHVRMAEPASQDIGPVVEALVRSFRFSIETVPSSEEVAELISRAGIPKKGDREPPPTGTTEPGSPG